MAEQFSTVSCVALEVKTAARGGRVRIGEMGLEGTCQGNSEIAGYCPCV